MGAVTEYICDGCGKRLTEKDGDHWVQVELEAKNVLIHKRMQQVTLQVVNDTGSAANTLDNLCRKCRAIALRTACTAIESEVEGFEKGVS